jgi:carbon-monoxide dehydrogenase iron sulfur subunit
MKRIVIHEENCIACRLCEVHCIVQHSRSHDIIKAFKVEQSRAMARVTVEESGPVSFALQCRQCLEPSCLEACISGAMHRDEKTGAVVCDEDVCVGCWMCIMVCPTGSIRQNTNHVGTTGRIASKCDLCYGAGIPACVAHCPNEALTYEETGAEAAPLAAGRGPSAGGAETIGRKAE